MRLVACPICHLQYDVTDVALPAFACRCGAEVENRPLKAVDAAIHRCGSCGALVGADTEKCEYCGSQIARDDGALSLICPECFARCEESARFCTACGVAFRPERVPVEGHEIPCPCCSVLMPPRQLAGIGLNECPRCNGLWVGGDCFDLLVNRALEARRDSDPQAVPHFEPRTTGANPAAQKVEYRRCPECEAFMQRRNYQKASGVILDVCHEHGTWLDADELEQIAGYILSGGRPGPEAFDPPEPSARQRLAEARLGALLHDRRDAERRRLQAGGGVVGSIVELLAGLFS